MLVRLLVVVLVLALLWVAALRRTRLRVRRGRRAPSRQSSGRRGLTPPRPLWVRKEVIRLKALMPENGCRKIAAVFNHLHAARRGVTVGKSFVASALHGKELEILRLRQKLKHRRPRPLPRNLIWAMDLTFVPSPGGSRTVLGVVDHGTRACVALRELKNKASIFLLRCLLDAIESYGEPKALRTDNEAVFTSHLFRFALLLLGIRHQRTAPFAPWQNGRIERFFGNFKKALRRWREIADQPEEIGDELATYRAFYNHLRPHQHVEGRTPAMAWSGQSPSGRPRPQYFSAWGGVLTGFHFPT